MKGEEQDRRRAAAESLKARMMAASWKRSHPDWRRWVIPCDCRKGCDRLFCTNR